MTFETFRAPDLARALAAVRAACGEDAMIVRTRSPQETADGQYEVLVADPVQIDRFRALLDSGTPPAGGVRQAPRIIALVGPAGAGKTTAAAKLALHAQAFGGSVVGLLTLDTYRVAAIEQLQTYAEIAALPFDVVYHAGELAGALRRLAACHVVIIDTPGRAQQGEEWTTLLQAAQPDEVHLVLPAGLRTDVALAARRSFAQCGITHLLLSRLDEVPGEAGVAELAETLALPARWVCDGPDVPADLAPAARRLLGALGSRGSVAA